MVVHTVIPAMQEIGKKIMMQAHGQKHENLSEK
jgi:hypothetical protein